MRVHLQAILLKSDEVSHLSRQLRSCHRRRLHTHHHLQLLTYHHLHPLRTGHHQRLPTAPFLLPCHLLLRQRQSSYPLHLRHRPRSSLMLAQECGLTETTRPHGPLLPVATTTRDPCPDR